MRTTKKNNPIRLLRLFLHFGFHLIPLLVTMRKTAKLHPTDNEAARKANRNKAVTLELLLFSPTAQLYKETLLSVKEQKMTSELDALYLNRNLEADMEFIGRVRGWRHWKYLKDAQIPELHKRITV